MKSFLLLFYFFLFTIHVSFAQGVWTWMTGPDTARAKAVFGTQGVPSVNNRPPSVYSPYCWTDLNGDFWLYGGITIFRGADTLGYDDTAAVYPVMWKFNPSTLEWTWMHGEKGFHLQAVFGTRGVPSPTNTPGSVSYMGCTWVDKNGDLWLYAGALTWKYTLSINEWTWMNGDTASAGYPVYGVKGIPSNTNTPGERGEIGSSWVDNTGKFWLYGGEGVDSTGFYGALGDMWMLDPATNLWTWESGSKLRKEAPVYGTQNVFSNLNTPGGRWPYGMWVDNNILWLYGGMHEYVSNFPMGYGEFHSYTDLWKYNITTHQWAWLNGSKTIDAEGKFRIPGQPLVACQPDATFYPDARFETRACWKDKEGNLWMFGGCGHNELSVLGDMWVYLSKCNQWARLSESSYINSLTAYGTKGIPSMSNHPGARMGCGHWQDKQGNFWIMGGYSAEPVFKNRLSSSNEMWRYTPDLSCLPKVEAKFAVVDTQLCCSAACIKLSNTSTYASVYQWNFPGANIGTSTEKEPSNICYEKEGNYDVELIAAGCLSSDTTIKHNYISITCLKPEIKINNDTAYVDKIKGATSYQWFKNGSKISGATDLNYTINENGVYAVLVRGVNDCRAVDSLSYTGCGFDYRFYPNPADEVIVIKLGLCRQQGIVKIFDCLGKLISQYEINNELEISTAHLPAAMYFITLQAEGALQKDKLVIVH